MATEPTEADLPDVPRGTLRRAIGASAIGNTVEWLDYGLFAYGVTYISVALFPGDEGTLLALLTFAVSFVFRPLGGLFWGPLGDRFGRKSILAVTILLMAVATMGLGLIPTYEAIGFWAPVLLILLRIVQGFSTGGEYGGAATFMAEYAPNNRRGFCGSFLEFGTLGGFSLGALLMLGCSLVLGEDAMQDWGWRLPFLIAGPLGLVGLYLRSKMEDTPVFRELEETGGKKEKTKTQFRDLVVRYWKPLLLLGGLVVALNVVNYTLLSYMPTYLQQEIGLSANGALVVPIIGQLSMMIFIPFAGALSDRVGRKPLWWVSLVGLFIMAVPMYQLMGTGFGGAVLGFAILGLLYVLQLATISAMFPAMFPTQVRFAGFAIAYNVSTALFGGTAPAVNDWLIGLTGNNLMPAFYTMGACAVGAIALLFVVETAGVSIRGEGIPGVSSQPRGGRPGSGSSSDQD